LDKHIERLATSVYGRKLRPLPYCYTVILTRYIFAMSTLEAGTTVLIFIEKNH